MWACLVPTSGKVAIRVSYHVGNTTLSALGILTLEPKRKTQKDINVVSPLARLLNKNGNEHRNSTSEIRDLRVPPDMITWRGDQQTDKGLGTVLYCTAYIHV